MQSKNKIVVIGGGYAGLRVIEKLAKNPQNEITLFDKESYHFLQTDVYDFIANEEDFAQVSVDLFTFCLGFDGNVRFIKEEVEGVHFEQNRVLTQTQRFSYDYLVIAVGARTKFVESVKGLRTHAHGIKVLHRAMFFKQKFEMALYTKVQLSGTVCEPINIVVTGGGLSGVEIAAQMASYAKEFYKRNNFICRALNIILINSTSRILSGIDEKLVQKSEEKLLSLGIKVYNNTKVVEITDNNVTLSSKEILPIDFMIFAGGIEPNALIPKLNIEKNEKGYLKTNEYLQLASYGNAFAIGDCTTIYNEDKVIAPTADVAEQMGELCAKNLELFKQDKALIAHNIKSRGILIALGRRYAVGRIFGVYIGGYFAFIMKKIVEKTYFYSLDRRSHKGHKKLFCDTL
ncbi:MAG: FAD-dependent oxidoreductase [Campylobacterales bacterium]|nr:FAD-dependent oxidoreductase [Campylobacterales bacterium]